MKNGTRALPACLYQARAGRMRAGVCISPRAHVRLFGGTCRPAEGSCPPEAIGCGDFGCAYPHRDADKVVKLTRDYSDFATLRLAGPRFAPRLHEAYQLTSERSPLYALVVERLLPATKVFRRLGEEAHPVVRSTLNCAVHRGRHDLRDWRENKAYIEQRQAVCCDPHFGDGKQFVRAGIPISSCRRFVREYAEADVALYNRGLDYNDYHVGNIGFSKLDRRWKILDLGTTRARTEEVARRMQRQPIDLLGRSIRESRKRRR